MKYLTYLPLRELSEFSADLLADIGTASRILWEVNVAEVYFHYSNARAVMIDRRGAAVSDLAEACEYAERVVRSLIMTPSTEDWRTWALHASDDRGDEIFVMPFASVLGKPH